MALIELKADFKSLLAVLTRIADALDRAIPFVVLPPSPPKPAGPESYHVVTNEELWDAEQEEERRQMEGLPPSPESTSVPRR